MLHGDTIELYRPHHENATGWATATYSDPTEISNVLIAPRQGHDLTPNTHPEGDEAVLTFHFPRTWVNANQPVNLAGCLISWAGRMWEVIGDPIAYPAVNTPGPWNLPVPARATTG